MRYPVNTDENLDQVKLEDIKIEPEKKNNATDTLNCIICYLICVNSTLFMNIDGEKDESLEEVNLNKIKTNFKNLSCPFNCDFSNKNLGGIAKHIKNTYNCEKCKATFCGPRAVGQYRQHMKSCTKVKKMYGCSVCSKQFEFKSYCERHINSSKCANVECEAPDKMFVVELKPNDSPISDSEFDNWSNEDGTLDSLVQKGRRLKIFKCFFCDEKCNSPFDLHVHMDSAHCEIFPESIENLEINNKCEKCDFHCKRKDTLNCHNKNFHKKVKTPRPKCSIECDKCKTVFPTRNSHRNHMKEVHGIRVYCYEIKKHFCHLCGKACQSPFVLKQHIKNVHEGIKDHKCETCGKCFGYEYILKRHIQVVHEGLKKEEICDLCGKVFGCPKGLKNHIERFHEKKEIEKNYICDTCGKAFINNYLLTDHVNYNHKGIQNYTCDLCGKGFAAQSYIKKHISMVHDGVKAFKCEICGKDFVNKTSVSNHIKLVHEGQRPYKCETCNKSFKSANYLKHHIEAIHEGKMKYNCKLCEKKFGHKEALRCHVKSFHEGIRYQCDFCSKSFTQKPHLKSHLRETHNEQLNAVKQV